MDAFTTHTGIDVPLRRSNVDTDQIIPAVYLKRGTRSGFEDGLFSAWRADDESFVLNIPPFDRGSVLVARAEFGIGSRREHAVWCRRAISPSRSRSTTTPAGGLLEGPDDIGLTLRHEADVTAFEAARPAQMPVTAG